MSTELCLLFYTHPYTHIMRDVDYVCVFKIVNVVEVCRIYCKHWSLNTVFVRFKLALDLPVFALSAIAITTVHKANVCVCISLNWVTLSNNFFLYVYVYSACIDLCVKRCK